MKRLIIIATLVWCGSAVAEDISQSIAIETKDFFVVRDLMRVNFEVTNNSAEVVKRVFVDCTFVDGSNSPVDTQADVVSNIGPGKKALGRVQVPGNPEIKGASCRVSAASS